MLELRFGVTDDLISMVKYSFSLIPMYKDLVPPNLNNRLKNMSWCMGVYSGNRCVAALWGHQDINLICHPKWKSRFITRRLLREFFTFFFSKYPTAIIKGKIYSELWKRIGFRSNGDILEASPKDISFIFK